MTEDDVLRTTAAARAGNLTGHPFEPSIVSELASWSEDDAMLAASLLRLAAAKSAQALGDGAASQRSSTAATSQRLYTLVSRDYDGAGARALRSYVQLGFPLTDLTDLTDLSADASFVEADAQRTLAYEALWPMFDELLRSETARGGGLLRASWDVQGGEFNAFGDWLGLQTIGSDMSLALLSFGFIYAFICIHSRSLLLGTLGTLEIFCSFPLALAVYREVLGIQVGDPAGRTGGLATLATLAAALSPPRLL